MSGEPLAHLVRRSPPWREPTKTECGRDLTDIAWHITRDEAKALIRKHGQQRAAFMLCMICVQTSDRYRDWAGSPTDVIAREVTSRYTLGGPGGTVQEHSQMDRELFAIAALIEAHRGEFDGYLADLDETVSLADRRRAQRAAKRVRGGS
jgi:hypothetical protein